MERINIDVMMDEISTVQRLINDSETALHLPQSHVNQDYVNSVSRMAPKLGPQLQKAINSGRPETAILGGVLIGGAYVATSIYDRIKNGMNAEACHKARQAMVGYYQRLTTLQGQLITRLEERNKELKSNAAYTAQRQQTIKKEIQHLKQLLDEMEKLIQKLKG